MPNVFFKFKLGQEVKTPAGKATIISVTHCLYGNRYEFAIKNIAGTAEMVFIYSEETLCEYNHEEKEIKPVKPLKCGQEVVFKNGETATIVSFSLGEGGDKNWLLQFISGRTLWYEEEALILSLKENETKEINYKFKVGDFVQLGLTNKYQGTILLRRIENAEKSYFVQFVNEQKSSEWYREQFLYLYKPDFKFQKGEKVCINNNYKGIILERKLEDFKILYLIKMEGIGKYWHKEDTLTSCDFPEEKPPIDLVPKYIRLAQRKEEIKQAIIRYMESGRQIKEDWIEEYNEIAAFELERAKDYKQTKKEEK